MKFQMSNFGYSSAAAAFTLIEVLLAVALSVMLFGSMVWFSRYAGEVRADATDRLGKVHSRRMVLDRMTEQLRSATLYPTAGLLVEGQVDTLTFGATTLPPPSVFNEYSATEQPPPPQQDVVKVTYRLRKVEDESGRVEVQGIEVAMQKLLMARVAEEEDGQESSREEPPANAQVQATLLSPYFRFIRFRYFDGSAWVEGDTWTGGELPRAVEVSIGERPLPEGVEPADYPYDLFRRVVHIHGSRRQSAGTIIREIFPSSGTGP